MPNGQPAQSELVIGKKFSDASKLSGIYFVVDVRKDLKDASEATLKATYSNAQQRAAINLAKSIKEN